jgi:ribosomal protein S8
VKNRSGVCLHYSLLTALLLEKLCEYGYISGEIKVIIIPGDRSSHAYTELKYENGNEYVIDPAQGFCGKKEIYEKKVLNRLAERMFY